MKKKTALLYVDDEAVNLLAFKANFRKTYEVYTAESAAKGLEILKEHEVPVIIADQRMPTTTGVEFFESIIADYPNSIRILLTAYSDVEAVIDAINKGKVNNYITKPWSQDELRRTIENGLKVYRLKGQQNQLFEKYRHLFNEFPAAVVLFNNEGKVMEINRAAQNLFQYDLNELEQINYDSVLESGAIKEEVMDIIRQKGKLDNFEFRVKDKSGNLIECVASTPLVQIDDDDPNNTFQVIIEKK